MPVAGSFYSAETPESTWKSLRGATIPLLFLACDPAAAWTFALIFVFVMGADQMLISAATGKYFGLATLGKLLAIIAVANSLGQWKGSWMAGAILDAMHNCNITGITETTGGVSGACLIYSISVDREEIAH